MRENEPDNNSHALASQPHNRYITSLTSSVQVRLLVTSLLHGSTRLGLPRRRVQPELHKDDHVLDDGAQRAEQPRQRGEDVLLLLRVGDQAGAVGEVARQRQEEEQQGQALARLLAVVLDDLRDPSTATRDMSAGGLSAEQRQFKRF